MNASKARDRRFWDRWERSGAVGQFARPMSVAYCSVTIEVVADDNGILLSPLTWGKVLRAIQAQHPDRKRHPFPMDVCLQAPIREVGMFTLEVHSARGADQVHVWVVPIVTR